MAALALVPVAAAKVAGKSVVGTMFPPSHSLTSAMTFRSWISCSPDYHLRQDRRRDCRLDARSARVRPVHLRG
jgi:hypothetical protein